MIREPTEDDYTAVFGTAALKPLSIGMGISSISSRKVMLALKALATMISDEGSISVLKEIEAAELNTALSQKVVTALDSAAIDLLESKENPLKPFLSKAFYAVIRDCLKKSQLGASYYLDDSHYINQLNQEAEQRSFKIVFDSGYQPRLEPISV